MSTWEILGIEPCDDEQAVRKAYAARVRQWRPDTHPQEFARLREAYEFALYEIREGVHAAQAADTVPAGEPEQPADEVDTRPLELEPLRPAPEQHAPAQPYEAAKALIAELAKCFSEAGEEAAITMLRRQFEAVSRDTIDARLEWEVVLLHSLLTDAVPPPGLVFEGSRLLGWTRRLDEVARMFGDGAAQRLGALLDLSYEHAYARHFSPNRWHARLFGAERFPWFGSTAQVTAAKGTAAYWSHVCQASGLESMMQLMSPTALRRVGGLMLLTCDVLFALLAGAVAWLLAMDAVWPPPNRLVALGKAALAFAVALPLPLLVRWLLRQTWVQRVIGWRQLFENIPGFITALVLGIIFVVALIASLPENPPAARIPGIAIVGFALTVFSGLLLTAFWMCLRAVELVLCKPWLWLQRAWGNHAFERACNTDEALRGAPTLVEYVKHLPAAVARGWQGYRAQKARREQDAKLQPPKSNGFSGAAFWWVLLALGLAQLVGKLAR